MANPFKRDSPGYIAGLRRDLIDFKSEYIDYLNATAKRAYGGEEVPRDAHRSQVMRKAVRAHRAVGETGIILAMWPPPVYRDSTPPLKGLAQVAFAHENEAYRGFSGLGLNVPRSHEMVLDAIDQADAILEVREEVARRRRRRPWYWIDRGLRALLGIPAYLVSVLLQFDLEELSDRRAKSLWWFSVAADAAGIFGLGRSLGWW